MDALLKKFDLLRTSYYKKIGKVNIQSTLHEVRYNPKKGQNTTGIRNSVTIQHNSTNLKNANESSYDVGDVITMRSTINNQ